MSKLCRPRSDCSYRNSLMRVYTVCHTFYIFWTHSCVLKPPCSNFSDNYSNNCRCPNIYYLSHLMTKPTKWHVRPAKTQISLGIRPVWSESLLCTQWVAKDPSFLHVDSKDSDQTGWMPRLIWVFTGRTCHFVGFVMRRLIFTLQILLSFFDLSFDGSGLQRWCHTKEYCYAISLAYQWTIILSITLFLHIVILFANIYVLLYLTWMGKNFYCHPAIISTITCAALMRVRVESVRHSITMAALKHIFRHIKMPITPLFVNETIKCGYSFS